MPAADDTRSLTYKELGDARGISPASAKRLALRHGWHKDHGNDGLARVRVPVTALETTPAANSARHPSDKSPATVPVATLARMQQEAESAVRAAEARAEQKAQEAEQHRERAARAEGERDGLREAVRRADALTAAAERRAEEAEARLRKRDARLDELQAMSREARKRVEELRLGQEAEVAALRGDVQAERERGNAALARAAEAERMAAELRAEAAAREGWSWAEGLRRAFSRRRGRP